MSIAGSLETFSLPELFQIIESGYKSGRLSIYPDFQHVSEELKGAFHLWFDQGNFVGIVNSLKEQYLINEIKNNNLVNRELLLRVKNLCPQNQSFCVYLKQRNLLTETQINSLFQLQLNIVSKLFEISSASFKFEEIDNNNKLLSNGTEFPWEEMTGERKKATEVSLAAMRNCSNWERFLEEMPPGNAGLIQLLDEHDFQLLPLESYLWKTADGTVSLQQIAQQMQVPLEKVQQTALAMIFAGLVEEVPIIQIALPKITSPQVSNEPVLTGAGKLNIKSPNQSKVSNSLLNNLVNFLRNNF